MRARQELEMCVAGCLLISGGAFARAIDIPADDFTMPAVRLIVDAAQAKEKIDPVIVFQHGGGKVPMSEITAPINTVPSSHNFSHYLAALKQEIHKHKLAALRQRFVLEAKESNDLLSLTEALAAQEAALKSLYLSENSDGSMLEEAAQFIETIEKGIDPPQLLPMQIDFLDEMFGGGLMPNELLVIGARPSTGKTALALQLATDCGEKVVLFSLEMSKRQVIPRLMASIALQNTRKATRKPSELTTEERAALLAVSPTLFDVCDRIRVYEAADQDIASIRKIARKEVGAGARMVIIDYLQLITCEAEIREQAVAKISRALKNMSKELNVPVVCLAQLSRECEKLNRPPILSDLRESGAIEQDANMVLFLHLTGKNDTEKNAPVCDIAALLEKNRDGGKAFRLMSFNRNHQRFSEKGKK